MSLNSSSNFFAFSSSEAGIFAICSNFLINRGLNVTSSSFIVIEYNLRLTMKELEFLSYLFKKEFFNLKFASL